MTLSLHYELPDAEAWAKEHAANLRHGRVLVPTVAETEPLAPATLVLVRSSDGERLGVPARVVMLLTEGPMRGTALELALDESLRARLVSFVEGGPGDAPPGDGAPSIADEFDAGADAGADADADAEADAGADADPDEGASDEETDDDARDDEGRLDPKIVRLRRLKVHERAKLAREGGLEDRVLLERLYGKSLWEELLRNPQLTVPEVAKIATKGTAPRVMLEQIVDNAAWSRQSIVRRALLANPRLSNDGATKLLRQTPRNELKTIAQGSAFPMAVRILAKKLLDE